MTYFLYILRSQGSGKYYVGSTSDMALRLRQHNGELPALGRYTVAGRPWELAFNAAFPSRTEALTAERYVKKMKSRRWIEKLIQGTYRLPDF